MALWDEYEIRISWTDQGQLLYKEYWKINEERKVMQFLLKFRSGYKVVRSKILNREIDPDVYCVLSELLREETHIITQVTLEERR